MWNSFANPNKFMRITDAILPWATGLAIALFAVGTYWSLWIVPPDFRQGDSARIMFVHVPAATMSILVYAMMCVSSLGALIWRHPIGDLSAKAAAPIGAAFCALSLVTGAIWGEPIWGTWWVWDARLTSQLILFFFYLGYMSTWDAFEDQAKAATAAAYICLVGSVFAILSKYSVLIWDTLHQGPSRSLDKEENLHDAFFYPLLVMTAAFYAYFMAVWLVRVRAEIRERRIARLTEEAARRAGRASA